MCYRPPRSYRPTFRDKAIGPSEKAFLGASVQVAWVLRTQCRGPCPRLQGLDAMMPREAKEAVGGPAAAGLATGVCDLREFARDALVRDDGAEQFIHETVNCVTHPCPPRHVALPETGRRGQSVVRSGKTQSWG